MNLPRGTLVLVDLEPTLGHEQRGKRPCVVVSDLAVNDNQRFPLMAVVPVTGTPAQGALYPRLAAGPSGLIKLSTAQAKLWPGLYGRAGSHRCRSLFLSGA